MISGLGFFLKTRFFSPPLGPSLAARTRYISQQHPYVVFKTHVRHYIYKMIENYFKLGSKKDIQIFYAFMLRYIIESMLEGVGVECI